MKIDPEDPRENDNSTSLRRRWGVPLAVATGVTAVSLAAVAAFGGTGDAGPQATETARPGGNPSPSATPSPGTPSTAPANSTESAFTVTSATTPPIATVTATGILNSCLGAAASKFHVVNAISVPTPSQTTDGVLVAVDSAGQYVQCQAKNGKGTTPNSPPTFINNRLWGEGRTISYFDSAMEPATKGQYLMYGAGHYTAAVAKITISYGEKPQEYPAKLAGGAFTYAATITPNTPQGKHYFGPTPYVHAYDASGKQIYNQAKDPQFAR
ncbi:MULTISPECIES: hypothetical protein [unclassified Streptomyces]|uniref:hypothetical protein n=1 Tax=unclassified Streptomyces TaxID=2593676 RepID=UPI0003631EF1|nr:MULTISPECIES: hypothetical protein [unclassified Streptomyces]